MGSMSVMPSAHAASDPRPGAASRADRDPVLACPGDEVRDDEVVAGEPEIGDHRDLVLEAFAVLGGLGALAEAPDEARARRPGEAALRGLPRLHRELGRHVLPELELQGAAPGDLQGVLDRLGDVREAVPASRPRSAGTAPRCSGAGGPGRRGSTPPGCTRAPRAPRTPGVRGSARRSSRPTGTPCSAARRTVSSRRASSPSRARAVRDRGSSGPRSGRAIRPRGGARAPARRGRRPGPPRRRGTRRSR